MNYGISTPTGRFVAGIYTFAPPWGPSAQLHWCPAGNGKSHVSATRPVSSTETDLHVGTRR
ncbi:hypothetical protein V1477_004140 [Vespula maculifrons]|uniref:Uncharacterized protein n=1 Tax=Vespula maculifrons TaxID=7453 RepID=A0ABD2CQP9_VESMC